MWSTKVLAALVLGGLVAVAGPAFADHKLGAENPGVGTADPRNDAEGSAAIPDRGQPEARDAQQVMGEIVGIDKAQGAIVLRTAFGPLALQALPEQLEGLRVGDVVVVSLVEEDEEEAATTH